jgi:threonyl-tRNA synthetase
VRTPAVVRKELWETSGHWALYRDNMFVLEDGDYVAGLKPMNCPESMLIYKTRVRSYRDLPMRLADYSWLFRNERTGALAGMFRVRQLTQDDSHVICRDDQVIDEVNLALSLVRRQYLPFGFEPRFKLATRPDKKLGTDEFWDMAESRLAEALAAGGIAYEMDPGGGAFYAPKIDVFIEDALGRQWQMATIQLDYQLPQRFELEYRSAEGGSERPVVIHYAIYGSFERFIGILVEHFAGAFPLWLAPVQAVVVPIADRHVPAAEELAGVLRSRGLRVEVDGSDNRMQNKIRLAQEQKVPYMLVLGDREIEARAAAPRTRAGEQQPAEGWESLADRLAGEAAVRGS